MVIYRKYRPRSFKEIVGQEDIVKILQSAIRKKSISHAYLFAGPRGTGKTSLARIFAKAVNCQTKGSVEPCNRCRTCQTIGAGRSLDFIEIDAASNRGIDEVRTLRESVKVAPTQADYKVYIIDEVHMLTKEAFNALLKTLEEPPEYVIFILATTEVHKVLPTILSRVQRFDFRLLGNEELKQRLKMLTRKEKAKLKDEVFDFIVHKASGSARNAETLLQQILVAGFKSPKSIKNFLGIQDDKVIWEFLEKLLELDGAGAIKLINNLEQEGASLPEFVKNSLLNLQRLLRFKLKLDKDLNLKGLADKFQLRQLVQYISLFLSAQEKLKLDIPPTLGLELLVAEVCTRQEPVIETSKTRKPEEKILTPEKPAVKAKKEETPAVESNPSQTQTKLDSDMQVSLGDIKDRWTEILENLKPLNHSLAAFLRFARPLKVEKNRLQLVFVHSFHKETIDNTRNKLMIEKILQQLFKTVILIETKLEKEVVANGGTKDMTAKALEMFGGRIVES